MRCCSYCPDSKHWITTYMYLTVWMHVNMVCVYAILCDNTYCCIHFIILQLTLMYWCVLITYYVRSTNCPVASLCRLFVAMMRHIQPMMNYAVRMWLQLVSTVLGHRCIALKDFRNESKAQIHALVPPAGATERLLTIEGTVEQIQKAQYLIQKRSDSVLSALLIFTHISCDLFDMS